MRAKLSVLFLVAARGCSLAYAKEATSQDSKDNAKRDPASEADIIGQFSPNTKIERVAARAVTYIRIVDNDLGIVCYAVNNDNIHCIAIPARR